jgi:hypothetical protein
MRTVISPVRASAALALLVLSVAPLMGQNPSKGGNIQGTVFGETGGPVVGALVTASRAAPAFSQTARSGPGGAFDLDGLPAGAYTLCVQVPGAGHLDPCRWSATPTTVTLSAGQISAGNRLVLKRASVLQVRIQDPDQYLSPRSAFVDPPQLLLGVLTPVGATSPAILSSTDRSGRTYEIAVAFDTPLTVAVSGKHVRITDTQGAAIQNSSASLNFMHTSSAAAIQPSFTFVVAGRTD